VRVRARASPSTGVTGNTTLTPLDAVDDDSLEIGTAPRLICPVPRPDTDRAAEAEDRTLPILLVLVLLLPLLLVAEAVGGSEDGKAGTAGRAFCDFWCLGCEFG